MRLLNYCSSAVQRALPAFCLLCSARSNASGLCDGCRGDLPMLPAQCCPVCATPTEDAAVCGACLSDPPAFDRVLAAYVYAFPVDSMVRALKYRGQLTIAPVIAQALIALAAADSRPDLVIPMPLSVARLRERGFNQAMEIARAVAAQIGAVLGADTCRRVRDTLPQTLLPWKERAKNIRRAFVCDADLQGMRVAVVDDVLTTGATLNELAAMLKKRGALEVRGYIVARALPR